MSPGVRNTLLAIFVSCGMIASFYYLERAFRTGDSRRAIQAVQSLHIDKGGSTVLDELVATYGKDARIHWIGNTENNFRGLILVTAHLPDGKSRQWRVDLIHGTIEAVPHET